MEKQFIFQDDMDVSAEDFNAVQGYARTAIEHLVADAVTPDRRFAGFATTKAGATTITVQPGRLLTGGKVYATDAVTPQDFATVLPVGLNRIASVVVYGNEIETVQQAREFLINEETGASEPRLVPTERSRVAYVNFVLGQESPDPIPPVTDAGVLVVAQILLSPIGITSVTMVQSNALDSVASVAARTADVEAFAAIARPKIVALSSDLASLKTAVSGTVDQASAGRILGRLAVLEAAAGIPAAATSSTVDFFNDASASDTAFAGYQARVEEGLRFAPVAISDPAPLAVQNALNPAAKLTGGWLFPAYTRELRLTSGPAQSEIGISTFTYAAYELQQNTASRARVRYGYGYAAVDGLPWWLQVPNVYVDNALTYGGEVLVHHDDQGRVSSYEIARPDWFWSDRSEDPYWSKTPVDHTINGSQIAETFLNGSDQWLTAIGLTFTRLANDGPATVAICETERGVAMLDRAISVTAVQRADMLLGVETVIPVQPVFLTGGKRYALVVISAANHWLATTQGENFPGGTFFTVVDGAYQQGDVSRDLCFSLYAAKFAAARAVIDLQPLQLAGGIVDIDLLASTIMPGSTDLSYEINVNNAWVPLSAAASVALNAGGALPPLVGFRAVFTGSQEVMPALQLTGSQVRLSRPRTTFTHVSTVRALPAPSTQIRVIARLERFDAAHHTAVAKLRSGAGYATVSAFTSAIDVDLGGGVIERTWLFNLGAGVSNYRIQIEGATDTLLTPFHVAWRKDFAL